MNLHQIRNMPMAVVDDEMEEEKDDSDDFAATLWAICGTNARFVLRVSVSVCVSVCLSVIMAACFLGRYDKIRAMLKKRYGITDVKEVNHINFIKDFGVNEFHDAEDREVRFSHSWVPRSHCVIGARPDAETPLIERKLESWKTKGFVKAWHSSLLHTSKKRRWRIACSDRDRALLLTASLKIPPYVPQPKNNLWCCGQRLWSQWFRQDEDVVLFFDGWSGMGNAITSLKAMLLDPGSRPDYADYLLCTLLPASGL
jgi:hypothetical protein